MAHGRPDWFNITPMIQLHASEDMNELAARLNQINVFDRRGNVIHWETFAEGLGDQTADFAGATSAAWSCAYGRHDMLGAKLAVGGSSGDIITLTHAQGAMLSATHGYEVSWSIVGTTGIIRVGLDSFDGTNRTRGLVEYDYTNSRFRYLDSAGAYQNIATGVALYTGGTSFNFMKLCVDFDAGEYLRLLANEHSYSLAGIALNVSASVTAPRDEAFIQVVGGGSVAADFHIDSLIHTINEA